MSKIDNLLVEKFMRIAKIDHLKESFEKKTKSPSKDYANRDTAVYSDLNNPAELIAYEIATLRPHDEARRAQLVRQLLSLIEGKSGGHVGRRGYWLPEDQGFTRSADKAVEAWRKYARALIQREQVNQKKTQLKEANFEDKGPDLPRHVEPGKSRWEHYKFNKETRTAVSDLLFAIKNYNGDDRNFDLEYYKRRVRLAIAEDLESFLQEASPETIKRMSDKISSAIMSKIDSLWQALHVQAGGRNYVTASSGKFWDEIDQITTDAIVTAQNESRNLKKKV